MLTLGGLVGSVGLAPGTAAAVGATPVTYIGPGPNTALATYSGVPESFASDGSTVWFTNDDADPSTGDYDNRVWKATSAGVVTAAATGAAAITHLALAASGGDVYYVEGGNVIKKVTSGGTVTTVAGSGTVGLGGEDDGDPLIADLNSIVDLAVGPGNKVYFVESSGHIRLVDSGTLSTLKGAANATCVVGGPMSGVLLPTPTSLAVDSNANVFAAANCGPDADNPDWRIVRFDAGLTTSSVIAGGGGTSLFSDGSAATSAKLINPIDTIGTATDGTPFFSTGGTGSGSGRLMKVVGGNLVFVAGQALDQAFVTGTAAPSVDVGEFVVEPSGSILVTGFSPLTGIGRLASNALTVLSPGSGDPANGAIVFGLPLMGASGLSTTPTGDLTVAAGNVPRIRTVNISGAITTIAGNGTTGAPVAGAALSSPLQTVTRPVVDNAGTTYAISGGQVVKVTAAGALTIVPIGAGLTPVAVVGAPDGNVYVAGTAGSDGAIRKVDSAGTVTPLATLTSLPPSDLALNPDGSLTYAPSTGTSLVKVTTAGATTTVPFGAPLASAAISVDPDGSVFVAQISGLFKVTAAGVVSQVGDTGGTDVAVNGNGDVYVLSGVKVLKYAGLGRPTAAYTPALGDDNAATRVATAVSIAVEANDTVVAGALGLPVLASSPAHGAAVINASNVVYTPTAGYTGLDQFTYRVCNTSAVTSCSTATITVTVADPILQTVAPARLFDTRPGEPQGSVPVPKQKMGRGTLFRIKVTGVSGVPATGASAVSLNVTVADPDSAGYVTVYPCGTLPLVSSVNYVAGQVVPNAVIAPISAAGEVCFFTSAATHLIADVNGYLATSSGFSTVAPVRLFDTRPGEAQAAITVTKTKIGGTTELKVKLTGVGGIPATGVGAVSLNVTVAEPDTAGFVTVYPCGTRPLVSSLNFVAGQVVPNAVIAPVSASGEVCFFSNTPTHLLADVNGWFAAAAGFSAVSPSRVFDTRTGEAQGTVNVTKQQIGGTTVLKVKFTGVSGIPSKGVGAVSLNVTAVNPSSAGFVTVYPCGSLPLVSSLNFLAGQVVPNAVIAPLTADGEACFYSNTTTDLIADVNGWFNG